MKYVLRLCKADYNGGTILSESIHDTFDAAMDAIPFQREYFRNCRVRSDLKNTIDSIGGWSITGIGNLSYVIHTMQ